MATLIDAAPTAAIPAGYPRELEREIRLQDGAAAQIRPIRPDDAERPIELYARLSYTPPYQRFFRVLKRLPPEWARLFANVDYHGRLALVAQHDAPHGPELVGVARYEPSDEPGTVEVAVVVQDGWQGRGLGVMLLGDLLAAAEARGIRSEEHTSELQSLAYLVCRLLLEKKKKKRYMRCRCENRHDHGVEHS